MSSNNGAKRRKNPKFYYVNAGAKRKKQDILDKHEKGFLITCNNRERECVREAYALLGEFADKLYGPDELSVPTSDANGDNIDIDAQIMREMMAIKDASAERRFQSVDCGAKNCVFIKTKVPDPCELVFSILNTIKTDQVQRSRFILRLIPVSVTCRTSLDDIQKALEPLLPKYFQNTAPEGKTYAIVVKIRNNNTIKRDDIIEALAPMVRELDSKNRVDLKTPQLSVVVEVVGKISCLAVVADYFQLKKYNVVELVANSSKDADPQRSCPAVKAPDVNPSVSDETDSKVVGVETNCAKTNANECNSETE